MSRQVININQNWLYAPSFEEKFIARECDESAFEAVHLPHANKTFPISGFDDKGFQFTSCYRKHLEIPASFKGQRVFVDFDGAMAAARVYLNGRFLLEHKGGYTPFWVDLTESIDWAGMNILAVELDSSERPDTPPFGGLIDYLTFGGIYRDVYLRAVHPAHIENVFVKPRRAASREGFLETVCFIAKPEGPLEVELRARVKKGGAILLEASTKTSLPEGHESVQTIFFKNCDCLERWDIDNPHVYEMEVALLRDGAEIDAFRTRFGYRECEFTPEGFKLNGQRLQLRGLNRHQTYPWVGAAMPARVQRRDADILKKEFKVNIVRTSHYPQSPHFLDRCDEIGLLVFEEIPGWQHIGDLDWQDLSCRNTADMVRRDWNHPSIVLWGTRINESIDNDPFYARTNAVAKELDDTRQTGGVRYLLDSHLFEDVFTFNDFDPVRLSAPRHPRHLVTEYGGHMFSTKHCDNTERLTEHTRRHAHIQSMAATTPGIAGAIGWCAFDYNTHKEFGSGDRICHHGVADMFRIPKFAAFVYKAQCPTSDEIVLEPAFHWALGDKSCADGVGEGIINSNCDSLRIYLDDEFIAELLPRRDLFPGLPHPPFMLGSQARGLWGKGWRRLRIEGCIQGEKVIERQLSESGVDACFVVQADDSELVGNGYDATRVAFQVTDEFGNYRNFAVGAIAFEISGPGEIIGDNPFALIGGSGAIWVRASIGAGTIHLVARHPYLGAQEIRIEVREE